MNLPAQLGADRAAGTGDEDPPVGEVTGDRLDVGIDLVPSQQVRELYVAQVAERDPRVHHLPQRRNHLHPDSGASRLLVRRV